MSTPTDTGPGDAVGPVTWRAPNADAVCAADTPSQHPCGSQTTVNPAPPSSPRAHERASVVTAAIVIGTASLLVMGLQPILLGGLAEAGRLSEAGVGYAATVELFGFAVGASLGPFVLNSRMRVKAISISLMLALVNMSIYLAKTSVLILAQRGFAGLLEGLLLGAVTLILTHTSRPERMSGLMLGLGTAPQVAAAYLLPVYILPRYGLNSGFVVLAASALLSAIASWAVVDHVEIRREEGHEQIRWTPALTAMVAAVFLQNAGTGAAWNYLERLAHQNQFAPAVVGASIAGSLALQVAGALVAAWLSWRLPSRGILIASAFMQATIVIGMTLVREPLPYIALSCAFGLCWLAQQPFQVSEIIALDPTRRVAMLVPPVALVGLSTGPLAVSFAMSPGDVRGGFWAAAALLLIVCILLIAPLRRAIASKQILARAGGVF